MLSHRLLVAAAGWFRCADPAGGHSDPAAGNTGLPVPRLPWRPAHYSHRAVCATVLRCWCRCRGPVGCDGAHIRGLGGRGPAGTLTCQALSWGSHVCYVLPMCCECASRSLPTAVLLASCDGPSILTFCSGFLTHSVSLCGVLHASFALSCRCLCGCQASSCSSSPSSTLP